MSENMQDVIVWFEGEIEKLKRSPSREMIKTNIAELEAELRSLKARFPSPPSSPPAQPEDAAATS